MRYCLLYITAMLVPSAIVLAPLLICVAVILL